MDSKGVLNQELIKMYPDINPYDIAGILETTANYIKYEMSGHEVVSFLTEQAIKLEESTLDNDSDAEYIAWLNAFKDD